MRYKKGLYFMITFYELDTVILTKFDTINNAEPQIHISWELELKHYYIHQVVYLKGLLILTT